MSVSIKTAAEMEKMRVAGRLTAEVLEMIEPLVQVGITTGELDRICHDYITNTQQAIPAPLNYNGFPRSICTSINDVVCHGIPSDRRKLKNGDIVNIDVTVIKLIDGMKLYLHGVIDSFSKKILSWHLTDRLEAVSCAAVLGDAIRLSTGSGTPMAVVDGGTENHASPVDEIVGEGLLRRIRAQTELCFSNSPIEAF